MILCITAFHHGNCWKDRIDHSKGLGPNKFDELPTQTQIRKAMMLLNTVSLRIDLQGPLINSASGVIIKRPVPIYNYRVTNIASLIV